MLVACRLGGLSALEAYYAGVDAHAQFGPTQRFGGLRRPRKFPLAGGRDHDDQPEERAMTARASKVKVRIPVSAGSSASEHEAKSHADES
jgi:hypothetical protein